MWIISRLETSEPMMEVDDCPPLRLDQLPTELLLHIFQFLDVDFILHAVAKVQFHQLPLAGFIFGVINLFTGLQPFLWTGVRRGHMESPRGKKIPRQTRCLIVPTIFNHLQWWWWWLQVSILHCHHPRTSAGLWHVPGGRRRQGCGRRRRRAGSPSPVPRPTTQLWDYSLWRWIL